MNDWLNFSYAGIGTLIYILFWCLFQLGDVKKDRAIQRHWLLRDKLYIAMSQQKQNNEIF